MHALIRSIWPTLWALSWGAFTLDTVSEAVLKKFCYSSRPQWNELGKLTKVGTIKQRGPVSLDERFGSDIWSRLQGKTVLDYGCGYGVDVNSLTEHGINAVGLEHRQDLVEASPAVSKGEFVHSSQTGPLAGAFDCILSINSFEHCLDPQSVLADMRRLLKPSGTVLITFSPPWLHPYGAHCREMTPLPWVQLLFPERAIVRMRQQYYSEKPGTCYEEVADGLAKMTIAKFKRSIAESPFKFMKLELIPIRKLRHLAKLPLMQELLTSTVRAELSIR